MRKLCLLLALLLVISLAACGNPEAPTTEPSTAPTTAPTTKPVTVPTTAPTTAPTTEPVSIDPLRQEGQRLTAEELAYFDQLFAAKSDPFSLNHKSYYNYALSDRFAVPQDMNLRIFFNGGFSNEHSQPITQEEVAFFNQAMGYDDQQFHAGNLQRLPAEMVAWYVDYYFGLTVEEMNHSGLRYWEETDCYYIFSSDTAIFPLQGFVDGYYEEANGTVALYYTDPMVDREYVVTLQSKRQLGEQGYYILSNLPVEE